MGSVHHISSWTDKFQNYKSCFQLISFFFFFFFFFFFSRLAVTLSTDSLYKYRLCHPSVGRSVWHYFRVCNWQNKTKINWATTWQNQQNECAPSEDSDQPGHPPSLIRVFAFHIKNTWVLSYPLSAQPRLWSGWADGQADLSLRWARTHFVGFVMSWLITLFIDHKSSFSGY